MVPLPLFKLAALFVRHVSKYGANQIKAQAHDHPSFRAFAAKYGQSIHQLNMKLSVALLRNPEAERRAKERAEAPTVKTEEQIKREEEVKQKNAANPSSQKKATPQSVWRRKFRPLPEAKAVDLFADVIGDAFILSVAVALIVYEYWKSSQKPDTTKERLEELNQKYEELKKKEDQLAEAEEKQRQRFENLEEALRSLKDPKTKQPMLPSLQVSMLGEISMPIVPITSSRELPSCLDTLRKQFSAARSRDDDIGERAEATGTHDLVQHCVPGKPLSRDQANVLTGTSTGFKDIANHISLQDSQFVLREYLGEVDARRIISFFTNGPTSADV
ncbi:Fc.00g069020.m01.CDS01 [Cosmosporella sp. VM-42]